MAALDAEVLAPGHECVNRSLLTAREEFLRVGDRNVAIFLGSDGDGKRKRENQARKYGPGDRFVS